jgi:hypothetical protein
MSLIILTLLFFGVFFTWYNEALGSYIKLISMDSKRNLVGNSLVQAIGVLSRFGFFVQSFAMAWIIDKRLFLSERLYLVIGCLLVVLLSIITLQYFGEKSTKMLFGFYSKYGLIEKLSYKPKNIKVFNIHLVPSFTQVFAYMLLYTGSFSVLLIQLIDIDFAARSIALSGIISGISTIILLSYIDVKFAHHIEKKGESSIPFELIMARFYATFILILFLLVINISV